MPRTKHQSLSFWSQGPSQRRGITFANPASIATRTSAACFEVGVIGIDPGLSGALALIPARRCGLVWTLDINAAVIEDMPVVSRNARREVSAPDVAEIIRHNLSGPMHAFVEMVGAAPIHHRRQGTSSMFSFGRSFGVLLGVLAALRVGITLVRPQDWRRGMQVNNGKDASRVRALELHPGLHSRLARIKDHGRADALLLATYGLRVFNREAEDIF